MKCLRGNKWWNKSRRFIKHTELYSETKTAALLQEQREQKGIARLHKYFPIQPTTRISASFPRNAGPWIHQWATTILPATWSRSRWPLDVILLPLANKKYKVEQSIQKLNRCLSWRVTRTVLVMFSCSNWTFPNCRFSEFSSHRHRHTLISQFIQHETIYPFQVSRAISLHLLVK